MRYTSIAYEINVLLLFLNINTNFVAKSYVQAITASANRQQHWMLKKNFIPYQKEFYG